MAIATNTTELAQAEAIAPVTRVRATRIGFLSDDHNTRDDGSDLPAAGLPVFEGIDTKAVLREKFGGPVDIVAFASTHREAAILKDGVLFVNPGSPTYPKGRAARVAGQRALGTVGVLDLSGGAAA